MSLPLYARNEILWEEGALDKQLPMGLEENLGHALRDYQKKALCYLQHVYHKHEQGEQHLLFHMATGSGKTLVMAGAILYFYAKGYRRFLFCSHMGVIMAKTRDNLTNSASSKYLFKAPTIQLNGSTVDLQETHAFGHAANDAQIELLFTTIQSLHGNLNEPKENTSLNLATLRREKMIILADEAHHLQVEAKQKGEDANWESSVKRILSAHKDHYLLEFTATMPEAVKQKYQNKELYRYTLRKYREDGYSKHIYCLVSDASVKQRILQALVLSQYRRAVASNAGLTIKPVILFKSKKIGEKNKQLFEGKTLEERCEWVEWAYKYFTEDFFHEVGVEDLVQLKAEWEAQTIDRRGEDLFTRSMLLKALNDFEARKGGWVGLIEELKRDFDKAHCRCLHSRGTQKDKEPLTLELNHLEDQTNTIRAIFAVDMLNEGWDVLNLYDIVRLYETKGAPKKTDVTQEAQLIGRGARYYPFVLKNGDVDAQSKYKRKFDGDNEHALRACEMLYYHCKQTSNFIQELNKVLEATGIKEKGTLQRMRLSETFKNSALYQRGELSLNTTRNSRQDIPKTLASMPYKHRLTQSREGELTQSRSGKSHAFSKDDIQTTLAIRDLGYAVLRTAIQKTAGLTYAYLRDRYEEADCPTTMRAFITKRLCAMPPIKLYGRDKRQVKNLSQKEKLTIARGFMEEVKKRMDTKALQKKGTPFTERKPIRHIFKAEHQLRVPEDKRRLTDRDELALLGYDALYVTEPERELIGWLKGKMPALQEQYTSLHLLRNERFFKIYAFEDGAAFEPDFVLFATKINGEQLCYQCFLEPKGSHLLEKDAWKAHFLSEIEHKAQPQQLTLPNGKRLLIVGFPFYNSEDPLMLADLNSQFNDTFNLK